MIMFESNVEEIKGLMIMIGSINSIARLDDIDSATDSLKRVGDS